MASLEEVLESATRRVTPSRLEYLVGNRFYNLVRSRLENCKELRRAYGKVSLEGSFAKDTWVSGSFDLDVFVIFPRELGRDWILDESLGLLEGCLSDLPFKVDFAQHPYLTVVLMGLEANVVPVLRAEKPGDTRLAVERTPFHTRYVWEKLTSELRRDVRLLKSFLKGVGVYGAEVKVGGFSGYLAELMVIHYGGFLDALKGIAGWSPPVVVDMEWGSDKGKLLKRFRDSPLIWVDPVDPSRNVAAAVRFEPLSRIVLAAKKFLAMPREDFFHYVNREDVPIVPPVDRGAVLVYKLDLSVLPEQTVYGELRRLESRVRGFLRNWGYNPVYTGSSTDLSSIAVVVVEVEGEKPELVLDVGPESWRNGAISYVESRARDSMPVWVGWDGRFYSYKRRKMTLRELLAKRWSEYTIPPHFKGHEPIVYPPGGEPDWLKSTVMDVWRRQPAWL
ncbi:MAG: CCA tRNA nucleotidyltransferase [Desulfurococcales archaeon]|nr:CCA tRNA nucleotidyltransferase [Desulfurococcales archaeon]